MRFSTMRSLPARLLLVAAGSTALGLVLSCSPAGAEKPEGVKPNYADQKPAAPGSDTRSWPTFFGNPQRNPVNTVERNIPMEWSIEEGQQMNIKWVQICGSRSYA